MERWSQTDTERDREMETDNNREIERRRDKDINRKGQRDKNGFKMHTVNMTILIVTRMINQKL